MRADQEIFITHLRKALLGVCERRAENGQSTPLRAIPIAFPISNESYDLIQEVNEPIGLIERYILEVACRFEPCSITDIAEFLRIEATRIKTYLRRLQDVSEDVHVDGEQVLVSPSLMDCLDVGGFRHTVVQEYGFVLNGLSGELLPVDFLNRHEEHILHLKDGASGRYMQDRLNRQYPRLTMLKHGRLTGSHVIAQAIRNGDQAVWEAMGVPPGAVDLHDASPKTQSLLWIVSVLLVDEVGDVEVQSLSREHVPLALPGQDSSKYVAAVCPEFAQLMACPSVSVEMMSKDGRLGDVVEGDGPGQFLLSASESDFKLTWNASACTDDVSKLKRRRTRALVDRIYWTGGPLWAPLDVQPADSSTASLVCVMQGLQHLRRELGSWTGGRDEPDKVALWWEQYQESYYRALPPALQSGKRPVNDLKVFAQYLPDTEFASRLDELVGRSGRHPDRTVAANAEIAGPEGRRGRKRGLVNWYHRHELGDRIKGLVQNARHRLFLISPVMSDPGTVEAIIEAKKSHGVDVRVITELRERVTDEVIRIPTRGFDGAGSLDKHFKAVRKLCRAGVPCRTTRYWVHPKLVIADDVAVLSSANLTEASLGWKGSAIEAGISVDCYGNADVFDALFTVSDELWRACPLRQNVRGKNVSIAEADVADCLTRSLQAIGSDMTLALTWPPAGLALRDMVVDELGKATETIVLCAWSFYDIDRITGFREVLEGALANGVAVTVLVGEDEQGKPNWEVGLKEELEGKGVRLFVVPGLHAKGVLVDGRRTIIMTGNLNPFSLESAADSAHIEIGLAGNAASPLLAGFARFLRGLSRYARWRSARKEG